MARDDSKHERMPPFAERLAYLQRRDDLKPSSDKMVELKAQGGRGACPSGSEPIPPLTN